MLPLAVILGGMMSVAVIILTVRMERVISTTEGVARERGAFYAADGATRAAVEVSTSEMLRQLGPTPEQLADPAALAALLAAQTAELQVAVNERISDITPPHYTVTKLALVGLSSRKGVRLDGGAFAGMEGFTQTLKLDVGVKQTDLVAPSSIELTTDVDRVFISLFQFSIYVEGYAYIYSGPGLKISGRIHVNGDACLGSGSENATAASGGLWLEKVTSSGSIFLTRSSGCRNESVFQPAASPRDVYLAMSPLTGGLADLNDTTRFRGAAAGCTSVSPVRCTEEHDRDGPTNVADAVSEADWVADAMTRWNGQVRDKSMGVKPLRLPITGKPLVQNGRDGAQRVAKNDTNLRFLVDPLFDGEPADVRDQKLAYKADLRILNGIWYVRDAAAPQSMGRAIWSDHPGRYTTNEDDGWASPSGKPVGQGDLFEANARPRRFSYYGTAPGVAATALANNPPGGAAPALAERPVISYGSLVRIDAPTPLWVPGHFPLKPCATCAPFGWQLLAAANRGELLQAARSGFRSHYNQVSNMAYYPEDDTARMNLGLGNFNPNGSAISNVQPINFDVQAFAAALKDTTPGELGSFFASRPFNGIVWIGSSWPGQLDGVGSASAPTDVMPKLWPFHGTQSAEDAAAEPFINSRAGVAPLVQASSGPPSDTDPSTTPTLPSGRDQQILNEPFEQALPYALCTDRGTDPVVVYEGAAGASTLTDAPTPFTVPACAAYRTGATPAKVFSRPNALRIINGSTLDATALPKGLTIATNIPAYVLGTMNLGSVPSTTPGVTSAGWLPFLLAADNVQILSSNWEDRRAAWNLDTILLYQQRFTHATDYRMEFLTGWLPSAADGHRDELTYVLRLNETWYDTGRAIVGSTVVGFNSVFGLRFDPHQDYSSQASSKLQAYDYNLDQATNQPPGAPLIVVTGVRAQRRP